MTGNSFRSTSKIIFSISKVLGVIPISSGWMSRLFLLTIHFCVIYTISSNFCFYISSNRIMGYPHITGNGNRAVLLMMFVTHVTSESAFFVFTLNSHQHITKLVYNFTKIKNSFCTDFTSVHMKIRRFVLLRIYFLFLSSAVYLTSGLILDISNIFDIIIFIFRVLQDVLLDFQFTYFVFAIKEYLATLTSTLNCDGRQFLTRITLHTLSPLSIRNPVHWKSFYYNIKKARYIHNSLCDLIKDVNKTYNVILLAHIVGTLLIFLLNTFLCVLLVVNEPFVECSIVLIGQIFSVLVQSLRTYDITRVCSAVSNEVRMIIYTIIITSVIFFKLLSVIHANVISIIIIRNNNM